MSDHAPAPLFEPAPPSIRDTLTLERVQFERWWEHLDLEDRDEFRFVFGGDELLARFVCSLDALIVAGHSPQEENSLLSLAYYIAARPYAGYAIAHDDPNLLVRAHQAYQHDAVQTLVERVKYRSTKRKRIKLENMVYAQAEAMVKDASLRDENGDPVYSMQDRKYAMDTARQLMALASEEDAVVRAERSRRGMANARDAMNRNLQDDNPRVLKTLLKAIVAKLPREDVAAIVAPPRELPGVVIEEDA